MAEIVIVIALLAIFFAAADRCKAQEIKELNWKIDDLLMVRDMRDTYIEELQQRLKRRVTIIAPIGYGEITFDDQRDICYSVPVYKN